MIQSIQAISLTKLSKNNVFLSFHTFPQTDRANSVKGYLLWSWYQTLIDEDKYGIPYLSNMENFKDPYLFKSV